MRAAILFWMFFLVGCDKPIITIEMKGQSDIPLPPPPPRFQIVMHPQYPGPHTYLLDTQTGAIWKPVGYTDLEGKPTVWQREDVVNGVAPSSGQQPEDLLNWFSWHKSTEAKK
jgi:hypothetical protein